MWSIGVIDLGLSEKQFWSLQPWMLDELLRRKERATLDTEFLFAQLTSVVANYSMSAPKKPIPPADFMPSEIVKQIEARRRGPTRKEREAIDAQARAIFNGIRQRYEEANGPSGPIDGA